MNDKIYSAGNLNIFVAGKL